tara:strand:+ start:4659 stop:6305 length:1647 start_codon:yes stop_codon:yes gene_type:complete
MTQSLPPQIDYTKRQFQDVFEELQAFVAASRPNDATDFFESNLGTALMELVAYVTDLLSYGQDIVAEEAFLATARRYDSALRFARSVGYVPRSAVSATTTLRSGALPSSIVTNGGVVVAGSAVTGLNGKRYEVVSDAAIAAGSSIAVITVREGQTYTETFTPTKSAGQTFQVTEGVVEQSSWEVYVGDATDAANKWTQVDNVAFELSATKTYEVFFDGDGRLSVRFGDGNAGRIPNQTITIRYRTTSGASGNTAVNTIRGSFRVEVNAGAIIESIEVTNSTATASGGQDRETIDELRASIPSYLRTLDRVVSIRDFDDALQRLAGIALSFSDVPTTAFSGSIVRSHIWSQEQVDFSSTSATGVTSTVKYQRYAVASGVRVNAAQLYLKPRTPVTTHTIVVTPTIAQVDLDLGIVYYDRANTRQTVHTAIVQAVVKLFEEASGFEIRLSDIYSRVLAVPGVRHFQIQSIVFEHIDPENPPTTIAESLHRDPPNNPGTSPLKDLVILGAVNRVFYDDTFLFTNELLYSGAIEDSTVQAINLRSLNLTLQA